MEPPYRRFVTNRALVTTAVGAFVTIEPNPWQVPFHTGSTAATRTAPPPTTTTALALSPFFNPNTNSSPKTSSKKRSIPSILPSVDLLQQGFQRKSEHPSSSSTPSSSSSLDVETFVSDMMQDLEQAGITVVVDDSTSSSSSDSSSNRPRSSITTQTKPVVSNPRKGGRGFFSFPSLSALAASRSNSSSNRKSTPATTAVTVPTPPIAPPPLPIKSTSSSTASSVMISTTKTDNDDDDDAKFGWGQRVESIKCLLVGGLVGSVAMAPVVAIHDLFLLQSLAPIDNNGFAQWEFDNDMAVFQAGLFAIVYRYCLREDVQKDQLKQGVVSAFVLTRTLSRIVLPPYCTALPLECGSPLGYVDWNMMAQISVNGIESLAMFGASAMAMDWCMKKGYISQFPG